MMKRAKVINGVAKVSGARMVIIKHFANKLHRTELKKARGKKITARFEKKIMRVGNNTAKLAKMKAKIDKKIAKKMKKKGPRKTANAMRDKGYKLKMSKRNKAL